MIDPQPAVRAGLALLLRHEPGLVPVGSASGLTGAPELVARERPDVLLLEHHLRDGDGIGFCRRIKAHGDRPAVVVYTSLPDDEIEILARVAGADGIVDKAADPQELFEAIRIVARGGFALPPLEPEHLEAAAHVIDPEDLALLAMLADGTPPDAAADTLRLDRRKVGRRIDRVLGRLRAGAMATVP